MNFRINFLIVVFLVGSFSAALAVGVPDKAKGALRGGSAGKSTPDFPYLAKITEDNVNIRSGPGTNHYACGNVSKADNVKVVSTLFGWSRIVPPVGSFSWISKQYVKIDTANPGIGIVTGDNVRVWAGGKELKPIHSTRQQTVLDVGEKVKLLGEELDDYYKITPPVGVYLWVSTKFTRPLDATEEIEPAVEKTIRAETSKAVVSAVVPTKLSTESEKLKEYYALEKQIRLEREKPIAKQDYAVMKRTLTEIISNASAGKAVRYSEFALRQIKRYELAIEVAKTVRLQDAQFYQTQEQIDEAYSAKAGEFEDLGKFAVIGRFQTSNVYGTEAQLRHYRITDKSGKIICYAVPNRAGMIGDVKQFVNKKVGLVGTIEPHLETKSALVRFTKVTELK